MMTANISIARISSKVNLPLCPTLSVFIGASPLGDPTLSVFIGASPLGDPTLSVFIGASPLEGLPPYLSLLGHPL
jgi:hypothetical protein